MLLLIAEVAQSGREGMEKQRDVGGGVFHLKKVGEEEVRFLDEKEGKKEGGVS